MKDSYCSKACIPRNVRRMTTEFTQCYFRSIKTVDGECMGFHGTTFHFSKKPADHTLPFHFSGGEIKRACVPVQVDQRMESCEESVPFKTTSSPSFALPDPWEMHMLPGTRISRGHFFSRGFLSRHARLTKRKRDHSGLLVV